MRQEDLVDRVVSRACVRRFRARARRLSKLIIDSESALDLYHLATGAYSPLQGFLGQADYRSVVEQKCLRDGTPWTIPIVLAVAKGRAAKLRSGQEVALFEENQNLIGTVEVDDIFEHPKRWAAQRLFGTTSASHPGAARLFKRGEVLLGGNISLVSRPQALEEPKGIYLTPRQMRRAFAGRGWQTVAAFHTRNLPHRAHEYLQRCALELVDGLLIHPIVGGNKRGDFETGAVLAGYRYLLKTFLPTHRVILAAFARPMEYAGPREAVFHAIVRRNFGCTHMIIGRDHAGVNHLYPIYAAHQIFDEIGDVGIQLLRMKGPFYCHKCAGVATENTCAHESAMRLPISGTDIRRFIVAGSRPPKELIRPELVDFLKRYERGHKLFCEERSPRVRRR